MELTINIKDKKKMASFLNLIRKYDYVEIVDVKEDSSDFPKEKSTFRSIFHKTQTIHVKALAREEAWFDPFGDDHAIPGLWQRERIVFPWKSVEGQGDRHFTVGGQQVAKLQKDVQALHDMENSGSEGGSIF
jgi:hypothetical protein